MKKKTQWLQAGIRLAFAAIFVSIGSFAGMILAGIALTFPAFKQNRAILSIGLGIELDKTGLTGDNLKLMEDLEKRMKLKGDQMTKEQIEMEVRTMLDPYKGIDIAKLKEMVGEDERGVRSILLKMGSEMAAMKKGVENGAEKVLDVRSQVAKWQEDNKDAIATIKAGQKADLKPLEIRVASPMTPANTLNGSAYIASFQIEAGVNEPVRREPTFWEYLKKGFTDSSVYIWVNKVNPLGEAAFIAPGVLKPGISFELESEISNAKKIAVSLKAATELLQDVKGMTSFIEDELRYALDDKTSTTLMNNVGSATVPKGLQNYSVLYSLVGVETQNANNWDAIVAAVAQLRAGNLKGRAVAFVNPIDYANMRLTKAVNQGQLFVPAQSGAEIVEDNNIPVGYVQVALIDYYRILIYKEFTISVGWENDDFTRNLVTFIAERRLHQFVNSAYAGFAIYDTFANIKAAIEEA